MINFLFFIYNDIFFAYGTKTFAENDPYGAMMALIGMGIVFSVLLLLFIIFSNTPALYKKDFREKINNLNPFKKKKKDKEAEETTDSENNKSVEEELSGEVSAAIATSLYLYKIELDAYEENVLTIKKVSRTYSPWNSKIYGLRNNITVNK